MARTSGTSRLSRLYARNSDAHTCRATTTLTLVLMAEKRVRAAFVEPMLLLRTEKLPEGKDWLYELKFDGYRALAIKSGGRMQLRSRNNNDFTARYSSITDALAGLPDDTIID